MVDARTRVAVTGATGFVGSILVQRLLELGFPTLALTRNHSRISGVDSIVVGELERADRLAATLERTDCVVHLAGRAHVLDETEQDPRAAFTRANVDATVRLAEASVEAKVGRFIFISTIKVHGEATSGTPFKSDDAPDPVGDYAETKWIAESRLRAMSAESGLELVIIRPPIVYGPGVKGNFARLTNWIQRGVWLPLGAATNERSMVSVFNLCDLIVRCIDHPQASGRTFLVSDGADLSTAELIRTLAVAINRPPRLLSVPVPVIRGALKLAGRGGDSSRLFDSLQVDIEETERMLDWKPPLSVEEGLSRCRQT